MLHAKIIDIEKNKIKLLKQKLLSNHLHTELQLFLQEM